VFTALLFAIAAGVTPPQAAADRPEAAILALVKAIYANDVAAYNAVTVPDPRRGRLTTGGHVNEAKLRELQSDPPSLQMRQSRPFLFEGREAKRDKNGQYPVGTTVLYSAVQGGSPMVVTLVRQPDGWKVDVRWWLAMLDLQSSGPRRGTPEFAARALTAALAAMDRTAAAKYATPGASSLTVLFQGAQREPSGVFDALAMEMPIVELRPGEFYPMRDRIVEGSAQPDMKVLLGQFGVVEIPYVVRRININGTDEWRVEPQPYYYWFNR
jgi:hypothetical protein